MKERFHKRRWPWVVLSIVLLLAGFRLLLPDLVRDYVNDKLDELPEYDGQVGNVDIHLIRGAYTIHDVDIQKVAGDIPVPFFEARSVDFSVGWRELFHGAAVGEIYVDRARLNFVKGEGKQDSQTSVDAVWLEVVKDLFPFKINRFEIRDSTVAFFDLHADPKVDLQMTNLVAVCTNLYNTRKLESELPADFQAKGRVIGDGELRLHVKLDPLADTPRFDLDLSLTDMDLTAINDLLEAYAKFNVKRGEFEAFAEIAANDGQFDGYVKPFFKDLDVFELKEDSKNPLKLAWQAIVAGAVKLFKNHEKDQVATKIPITGTFEKTDVGVWTAVANVLRNAFVEAFNARVDRSIDLFNRDEEGKKKEPPKEDRREKRSLQTRSN